MSFKLIAIRPIYSKENIFLKNLSTDCFYKFNNNYDFKIENTDNVIINKNNDDIQNLYDQSIKHKNGETKELSINISAIVGKNGSGKSSLMELLYVTFYKISRETKIIDFEKEEQEKSDRAELQDVKLSQKLELVAQIIRNEKNVIQHIDNREKELEFQYRNTIFELNDRLKKDVAESEYDKNIKNIRIEIYYEIDDNLFLLKLDDNIIELFPVKDGIINILEKTLIKNKDEFKGISEKIFYNLTVNYSLYGLNSNDSGFWIEKLFHKNDSYQTPIVLNPFRDKGIIDINSENYLVRSRLLALILAKDVNNKEIAQEKEIKRIKLGFIDKKLPDTLVYWEHFKYHFFPKLHTYFFTEPIEGKSIDLEKIDFSLKPDKIYTKTLEYILKKIVNIVERYPTFKKYIATKDNEFVNSELENDLIIDLFQDRSHISLKIKQALNFYEYQKYVDDNILEKEKTIPISSLEDEVNSYHELNDFVDLIEYIPPSFFKIELYFDEENDDNNFSNLSSGEKQKIYSLNSIVYHLRNLLSVNKNPNKDDLIVYNNFNIILDEIELYYHPELQRTFIYDLLEYIKKIDFENRYFDCIPNINIIFITHSPFILSDIPKQNILFLDINKTTQKSQPQIYEEDNTFAGNIHEMLTNGFFLESTKGEFAISKINEFLAFYKRKEELSKVDFFNQREYFKRIILSIGEEYIRNILQNQFEELDKKFNPKYLIEKHQELKNQLDKIEEQLNKDS
ncbi:ATP-binding protein [Chryseobacterium limigenitum]|uniref:ABC transporter n=1 Tax=Chryseobacterium limigenitum TaxID=1612149 RepID=A0A1K2IH32_9FLAO|nr:ATP-binding protein [Chryseobacterium limigenitum]SFZ91544.1 ABC transporter [Chryseobacterium limigenitum]